MGRQKGNGVAPKEPYAMMLLLAFGAAALGVMVLHKLRERRIFNLVVRDQTAIMSLHLLLQKERDSTKEVKRKNEEMTAKLYSLASQKIELSNRIIEMESMSDSLKEEQRILESALEEKQNEIKILREKEMDSTKAISQVTALTQLLQQKEDEIEEMKHHLKSTAHIWSPSIDDSSNPPTNLTATRNIVSEVENKVDKKKVDGAIAKEGGLQESKNAKDGQNLTMHEGRIENGKDDIGQTEILREGLLQKLENNMDGESSEEQGENGKRISDKSQGMGENKDEKFEKPRGFQDGEVSRVASTMNNRTNDGNSHDSQVSETKNEYGDSKVMDSKEHDTIRDEQPKRLHYGKGRDPDVVANDRIKLEMANGSQNGDGSSMRGIHGSRSKMKGKRWRMVSENRELKKNPSDGIGMDLRSRTSDKDEAKTGKKRQMSEIGNLERFMSYQVDKKGLNTRDEHAHGDTVANEEQGNGHLEMIERSKTVEIRTNDDNQIRLEGKEEKELPNRGRSEMPKNSTGRSSQHAEHLMVDDTSASTVHQEGRNGEVISKNEKLVKPQSSLYGEGLIRNVIDEAEGRAVNVFEQPVDQEAGSIRRQDMITTTTNNRESSEKATGYEEQTTLEVAHIGEQEEANDIEADEEANGGKDGETEF
uniref:Uncharacterized protein n=1 Tax=Nelumbo nucifera TaxID=4432 RepID=A0A822XLE1_NELNU|nr:TPA_asm: hypothetical protein HUJ06_022275 [Nelumbo nucifera]